MVTQLPWTLCGWSEVHVMCSQTLSKKKGCPCRLTARHSRTRPYGCQCHTSWRTIEASQKHIVINVLKTLWQRENNRFQDDRFTLVTFRWQNSGCKVASSSTAKHNPRSMERGWLETTGEATFSQWHALARSCCSLGSSWSGTDNHPRAASLSAWPVKIVAFDASSVSESKRQ